MLEVSQLDGDRIFLLRGLLSAAECERLVATSERAGFEEAPINAGAEAHVLKEVRNNRRVMLDDAGLAADLFARARPMLPERLRRQGLAWELSGLNERLRFYRYESGERFVPHHDGAYRAPDGRLSFLTFMVYLNEGCTGGETRFYRREGMAEMAPAFDVRPETGTALVFDHEELHEGSPVLSGRKYVVRSDVMYRPAAVPATPA